jgi:hypothetical protein
MDLLLFFCMVKDLCNVLLLFFRWYWDLVMVITLGITLLVLPVEVAFYSDNEGHSSHTWMSINMIVDIIFMVDIAFNFRTGYIHTGVDQVYYWCIPKQTQ